MQNCVIFYCNSFHLTKSALDILSILGMISVVTLLGTITTITASQQCLMLINSPCEAHKEQCQELCNLKLYNKKTCLTGCQRKFTSLKIVWQILLIIMFPSHILMEVLVLSQVVLCNQKHSHVLKQSANSIGRLPHCLVEKHLTDTAVLQQQQCLFPVSI